MLRGLGSLKKPQAENPFSEEILIYSGNSENPACGEDTPVYRDFSPSILRGEGESGVRKTFGRIGLPICKGNSAQSPVKINISHHS